MSASHISLASLLSFFQKLSHLVEIWRSSDENNFAQFFETRCMPHQQNKNWVYANDQSLTHSSNCVHVHRLDRNPCWCLVISYCCVEDNRVHQVCTGKQINSDKLCWKCPPMARTQGRKGVSHWSTASLISDCSKMHHTCSRRCRSSSMSWIQVSYTCCWMTDQIA